MLLSLQVRNFAIVDEIDIEFAAGMTVLTGETGAGKSILVDAIGLVLGERGGAKLVRTGAKRADFVAAFDLAAVPTAQRWLAERDLDDDDDCVLRRTINADGRSRAFINGNAVTVAELKQLGEHLLDIHGQHFHQSLGRRSMQRQLLDHYAGASELAAETAAAFATMQKLSGEIDAIRKADADKAARIDLLSFQLQEFEALALRSGEPDDLLAERQKLKYAGRLAEGVAAGLAALTDDETTSASRCLAEASRRIDALADVDASLAAVSEMLASATIHVDEAADVLRRYGDGIDMDPARRDIVEERLDAIQALARKHRCEAPDLAAVEARLRDECDALQHSEARFDALQLELTSARERYAAVAKSLSRQRRKAAGEFASDVSAAMQDLGMPGGRFDVNLETIAGGSRFGAEQVEFLICANPGQDAQALSKVASGGELSRMSLSIQVIASGGSEIPTLIFDEVDSGVGGGVAEMVGLRLQEVGRTRQVLSVTHLPQVASLADQHFCISKITDGQTTRTQVRQLNHDERVAELGRMLGGVELTEKTLEHAAEMLADAPKKRA